eukprot:Gb_15310 [translate_table: standard]
MNSWSLSWNSNLLFDFFNLDLFSAHHARAAAQSLFCKDSTTFFASIKTSISTRSCMVPLSASFTAVS